MTTKTFTRCLASMLIAGLLIAAGSGCGKAKKTYHLSRANKYYAAEQYDSAEIEYLKVLSSPPPNPTAIARLGLIYYTEGKLPRAFGYLQKTVELQPDNFEARVKLGNILRGAGKNEEAREQALKTLEKQPGNSEALMLLADASTSSNEVHETLQRLDALPAQAKNTAGYHLANGLLAARQKDLAKAEAEFKQAIALDPKSDTAQMALGNLYLARKDLVQAEPCLKAAAELAPLRSNSRLRYAEFKAQSGDVETAKKLVTEITQKAPDYVPAWMLLARLAAAEKKPDECAALLQKVLARDPANYEALTLNGDLLLAKGDGTNAAIQFERIITAYGTNIPPPQARYNLARAQILNRQEVKAIGTLQQVVAADTNNIEAVLLLANLNLRQGAFGPAVSSLSHLIEQRPRVAQAYPLLAQGYIGQKNNIEAANVYRRMRQEFPASPEVSFAAGNGLASLSQTNDAVVAYRHVVEISPTNAQALFVAGRNLAILKQNQDARQAFEKALKLSPAFMPAIEGLNDLDLQQNRAADAIARAKAAIAQDPKAAVPWLLLAKIHMSKVEDAINAARTTLGGATVLTLAQVPAAQGDIKDEETALLKAIELDPQLSASYEMLAKLYAFSNKQQQALDQLNSRVAKTNDIVSFMQIGLIQDQLRNYPAARDAYETVLKLQPNAVEALNNLAYLYAERLNQLDRAYELADKARTLAPQSPAIADTLGWVLYKRGEYGRALALIEEGAKDAPGQPEIQCHLGLTYYMLGQEAPAKLALQVAAGSAQDFPGKAEATNCLAVLAIDVTASDPNAAATLEKRLQDQPRDPVVLARLGALQERDNSFDKAARTYETALKYHPQNSQFMFKLARLYADHLKQPDKALDLAKTAHTLDTEDPGISQLMGRLLFLKGDSKWAASLFEDCARKLPNDPQVAYDLAWAYYTLGRVAEAEARMQSTAQAGAAFPKAGDAKQFLALLAAARDPAQAEQMSPQADKMLAADPDCLPALMVSALVQEKRGNYPQAGQAYDRILARWPSFSPATRNLAILTFERLGDDKKAYDLATKARAAFPEDPQVARTLGILGYKRADYTRAAQLLKESARNRKDDGELLYYLGMAQYQLKARPEAKAALQQALALRLAPSLAAEAKKVVAELK